MSDVRCFFLTPTDRYQLALRRFRHTDKGACTNGSYHDATVVIGVETHATQPACAPSEDRFPRDDPRWPPKCSVCGEAFTPDDEWQIRYETMHSRSDGGPETTIRDAPPGAMWDAERFAADSRGPDGVHLVVRLPDGRDWVVDGPSYNNGVQGPGWSRTGTIPRVTARPSILTPGYHGFLTDGVLTSC